MGDIMSFAANKKLFLGTFIHSSALETLEYHHNAAVCVDEEGTIVAVEYDCDRAKAEEELLPKLGWTREQTAVTACKDGQFFFPGFVGMSYPTPRSEGIIY